MKYNYLTNIELEKARDEYVAELICNGLSHGEEIVPVVGAAGRVTSKAVYARICAPHYNAAAMDGIAVDAKHTYGASETTPVILRAEQYKLIDTGDPISDGFDAVIMIEDVIFCDTAEDDKACGDIKLYEPATPWMHIRQIGEDICAGEMLLPSYSKITPSALGAMIASGLTEVSVIKHPMVGIIPTGNEIVQPAENPKEGEIPEFNSVIYTAMLNEWGADARTFPIVKDDEELIEKALNTALLECEIVLIIAGSSAGREDYTASVISKTGKVMFHGIAIKPGKPAILGYAQRDSSLVPSVQPIIGVPGYPVSGIIVLEQLVKPVIEQLYCNENETIGYADAILSKSVASTLKYREFVRVRMGYVNDKLIASPLGRGSGIVTSFMRADGILEVPQEVEGYESGKSVSIRLMRKEEELKNSIVIIGSHDPLIDELSDLMRINNSKYTISSAHVGSMGGILAIKKGEAHIAGTHLLDEITGEYNTSFVNKLIPGGNVKLIKCVKRKQGLILQKGNPLNIQGALDLLQKDIKYVNRQKGSGTRILFDYLCKKEGINITGIYGYEREEFTHTSVAALVASGSANVGMGIYSAAKMYDLDFLPICEEEYDFLIPETMLAMPAIKELIDILKSEPFKSRLTALGGYTF